MPQPIIANNTFIRSLYPVGVHADECCVSCRHLAADHTVYPAHGCATCTCTGFKFVEV